MEKFNGCDNASCGAPTHFKDKFENFWYHYKWHSIVSLFIVFVIIVCSFQMCQKEKYDAYILYAGEHEIKKTSSDGDVAEYPSVIASLKRASEDFDDDGNVSISLKDLFIMSSEQIEEVEKDGKLEVNTTLIKENREILRETLLFSDYYVCFLSPEIYEDYKNIDGVDLFVPLEKYNEKNTGLVYNDASSIYLSSTNFYSLSGISDLPDDTLVCLRSISAVSSHFDKDGNEKAFSCGEKIIKRIINYDY